nr:hypothetical protein [uncultured bacterium]
MTAQNIQKPEIKWDQRAFDAWQATLPPERIADDEKLLKRIFNLATYSPTLKEALDWAEQHGIKFFIDRTAVNCNGHHTPGTGIIGIVRDKAEKNLQLVAGTVAHEIRHAWQHYHGLNKTLSPSCADYFIGLSLVEADASAFGERVRDELKAVPASLQSSQENRNSDLEGKFLSWFYNSKKTEFYGDKSSKAYGRHWGIYSGDQVKHNFEFAASAPARKEGIDITHV